MISEYYFYIFRILAQHEDLTMFLQGPELSDLISDYYYNRPESRQLALPGPPTPRGTTASTVSTKQYPILPDIPSRRHSDTSQPAEPSAEQEEDTQLVRANSDVTSDGKVRMIMEKPSTPLPLTMNEVMQHYKIIEAKGLSSNWNNYMHVGKAS
ncbi:hypothetical protein LOTGIDRAFT_238839 [Lottia gigantea]|uniref:Uncharacterized protein n=1 Tax=Lottia gigantea TaxID=225164 RepID=V4AVR5_LOTGI|nr:hypothetical protein LOTGIDRAFT_238839 [Lottia gigantea]ESO99150.1 hypothetical protein LOTGIDRAFT_238839 [Lottia gigantea]